MKKIDSKIYCFLMITICFFGIFIKMHYAPDTYFVYSNTDVAVIKQFFSCGRFITGIASALCIRVFKLNEKSIYLFSFILAILCTTTSLYKFSNLIKRDIKKQICTIIFSILVTINIFSFELYVYIEKGIMMFSVLMSILAVEQVYKHLESKKWKNFIFAILYMLMATCSYQGTVGIFVSISLIYIIKYSKTIKSFLINNVKVAIIYGIPSIINFFTVRFFYFNNRVKGKIIFLESVQKIIKGIQSIFTNTYNLFPKNIFSALLFGTILFIIYKSIFTKGKFKTKILKILGIVYVFMGTLMATIAPQMLQNTEEIWFVARSTYPIASIIGILLIYAYIQFDIKKIEETIIILFSIIFIVIQLSVFRTFAIDGYIVNNMDKKETLEILQQIEMYEKQTGKQINKIAIYKDKNITYTYSGIITSGDINTRALASEWAAKDIINYYSGKKLKTTQTNKNIKENFNKQDWDKYDKNQIIFEDNTIHLCIY